VREALGVLEAVARLNVECAFVTLTPALSHGERELMAPFPGPLSLRERVRVREMVLRSHSLNRF